MKETVKFNQFDGIHEFPNGMKIAYFLGIIGHPKLGDLPHELIRTSPVVKVDYAEDGKTPVRIETKNTIYVPNE